MKALPFHTFGVINKAVDISGPKKVSFIYSDLETCRKWPYLIDTLSKENSALIGQYENMPT